jgi:cysteine synthase A
MSGIEAIGGTPAVRLERLAGEDSAEVWVKLEGANPTGSYKDRMALAMIEAAERDGRLRPGQPVVEYTGGSTGSSLAFVCAVKGHPLRIVSSDAFALEKIRTMQAFGAEVELLPSPQGITPDLIPAMTRRAAEIAAETGHSRPTSSTTSTCWTATGPSARSCWSGCPVPRPSGRSAATSAPRAASSAPPGR